MTPSKNYVDQIHPDFRRFRFLNRPLPGLFPKKVANFFLRKIYKQIKMSDGISTIYKTIKGFEGRNLNIEIYQPKQSDELSPCIIAFHGGGFCYAALPWYKKLFDIYVNKTKAKLVFVDYTLTTKKPFPAGAEDCYLASRWVHAHATELGIDENRILLYGDSAGGALAAIVAQMLRDRNQFSPIFQMLIYPITDGRMQTESAKKYTHVPIWNTRCTQDANKLYVKGYKPPYPAYAFPTQASGFSNLPSAFIEVAEFDSLRDEGLNYATALQNGGTTVEVSEIKGAIHAFELNTKSEITRKAVEHRVRIMNRVLNEI